MQNDMSYNTEKIIVKNEDNGKEEYVKLFYSTITDNVGITCGEQDVFLTEDQFKALAYLMRRCFYTRDMLEKENRELKDFAKAIHSFMKDKKIYMEKGTFCGYRLGSPAVCSTACLECDSYLGVIDECGVICRQTLYGVKVKSEIR